MIVKEETVLTTVILKTAEVYTAVATCSFTFNSDMELFDFAVPSVHAMTLSPVAIGLSLNSREKFSSYFCFFMFNSVCSLVSVSI